MGQLTLDRMPVRSGWCRLNVLNAALLLVIGALQLQKGLSALL